MTKKIIPKKPIFNHDNKGITYLTQSEFDSWWNKEIVPLFDNTIEVTGHHNTDYNTFHMFADVSHLIPQKIRPSHKALLINIQPIKKASD